MFNAKKVSVSRQSRTITTDKYGAEVISYVTETPINIFISLSNETVYGSNDMRINQCNFIGVTSDTVQVGDKLANKYTVEFINGSGLESIVYLKEIEGNGSFI